MSLTLPAGFPADRFTDDPVERLLYARDLAPVPAIMTKPFFRTLPDAVLRPADGGQVAAVLGQASRERVPVTPRAAASTSYYNTVPVDGGVVLDVNDLRGPAPQVDAATQTVRVGPAMTWAQLDDLLQQQGWAVRSYPSSAVSATVGGWISMEGMGLGSLKYGPLADHLRSLQVALPNGHLMTVRRDTDPPLDWFVSAEGTLGVITEVELAVRPRPEAEAQHLFGYERLDQLAAATARLAQAEPRPFTVFFADDGYLRLLSRSGFATPLDGSPATGAERGLLLVSYQGSPEEVQRGESRLLGLPGRELPATLAAEEWELRLYHLRTKRCGPALLAAEQWLPLAGLSGYLAGVQAMSRRHRMTIGTYGLAIAPDQALVMTLYPTDEAHTVDYLGAIGFTKRLHDLGRRFGARPYGVGLWNSSYIGRLHSRERLAELRRRKAQLDPAGIMNPGKLYRPRFPLWPLTFGIGAEMLAAMYVTVGRRQA